MQKYHTNNEAKMRQYHVMMDLARDPTSSLYNSDGTHNRGASHRGTFWDGYEFGAKYPHRVPGTRSLSYCVWRAGIDFKGEQDA